MRGILVNLPATFTFLALAFAVEPVKATTLSSAFDDTNDSKLAELAV